jgi:hypothetical protein
MSFKTLRKGSSQAVRDKLRREYAQLFCAQVQDTVADEHYNRASFDKLEACVRELYNGGWRKMFEKADLREYQRDTSPNSRVGDHPEAA